MSGPLDKLASEALGCTICSASLPLGPRPVFQVHRQARILIAGQAPGVRVHESGQPFDDASGDRLRQWMGLNREDFYDRSQVAILPMGFCYPGRGKSGDLPPRQECAPTWRTRFLEAMPNIRLTLVIGRYAQSWHLPETARQPLTQIVKDWASFGPEVIPLPHPSPRNNIWLKKNPWFEAELVPALSARAQSALKRS